MASSQVEIASSSPFGYVLKDRNWHDHRYRTRESNAFQKNFKDLVHTHLNSCISGHSRNSGSVSNGKLNHQIDYTDLWVHNPQSPTNENNHRSCNLDDRRISGHSDSNENSPHHHIDYADLRVHNPQRNNSDNNPKKSRAGKNWDKARDMIFAFERKCQDTSSGGPVLTSQRGRSPDSPSSWSVSTSQRGMSHEVASPRPVPLFQRGKIQEGIPSGHDLRSQRENSPVKSESSVEVQSLGGVSSLVRKWRDFEAEARCFSATNSPVCSSRSNSGQFFTDNSSFADAAHRGSDASEEFVDLRPATPSKSEYLFVDWESDQTGLSGPPSSRGRDSDATESERTRVADIIKKLTSNNEDHNDTVSHESLPSVRTSLDKSEQRVFSPVSSSPRIRGRQAFADLLMQMERDRHRELEGLVRSKAVSRFSHRGRIQAMLRIRFLRRGAEGKDGRVHSNSTSSDSNRLTPSAIMHIRERFNAGAQHCGTDLRCQQGEAVDKMSEGENPPTIYQKRKENHQQELTEPTKSPKAVVDNDVSTEEPITPNPIVDTNHHESNTMVHRNALQVQRSEIFHQEVIPSSDDMQQRTNSQSSNYGKQEFIFTATSMKMDEANKNSEIEEYNNQKLTASSNAFIDVMSKAKGDWEEEEDTHQQLVVSECSQESDVSHPFSGWEEQDDYHQQVEMNQDWISDVSRPRSAWEDLRQERYQEMLGPFVENDDIRQLLKRKSVSNFLSSGLRESIDRLMMSRIQSQPNQLANQREEEHKRYQVEEGEVAKKGEMQEEEQKEPEEKVEEEGESVDHNNDFEENETDEIQIGQECKESQDYVEQTTSWLSQDHEDDYFDPSAFPSPQQSLSSPSSSPETQPCSSFNNRPSIEMEFIYKLRGKMEQLHQEISELGRSVKSCINMQMKLQQSLTQDVTTASCHSGRKKRKDYFLSKKSSRGRCCICYEMQIDSLLYRCGHMCMCFKCASDLQWGSGKCPICQAPIIDVVRAYACS